MVPHICAADVGVRATITSALASLLSQNNRQPVLPAADYHHLRVLALGQRLRRLNALPLQQLRADALRHNLLEVANAGRLNAFALGLLAFTLQAEAHRQRLLLGLLLLLDRSLQRRRQLNVAQQNALHLDAPAAEDGGEL